ESDAWMPVDLYIGGIEHATMHLIYARYFYKVLRDLGMVSGDEPFTKLICQGMVLKDGAKMSKSKGNVVDPDEVLSQYGADALRLFMTFAAPIEKELDWTGFEGIEGATRFLKRVSKLVDDHGVTAAALPAKDALSKEEKALLVKLHQTIARLTGDLETRYSFNTVVSGLMELSNAIGELPVDAPHRGAVMQHALERFALMLSPVAPHAAEALWAQLGGQGLAMKAAWPEADAAFLQADEALVVVQVNGKLRGRITLPSSATEDDRRAAALASEEVRPWLDGKEIVKIVVPPGGKLVSIVIKG
ncbi:MAG TPA: class I tRNA ligase family protein, partial [Holophagaceae bacterium]|nr:class I tRNA ligase family protein [Holophagaceae bacterium]